MKWFRRSSFNSSTSTDKNNPILEEDNELEFTSDLERNEKMIQATFQHCSDLVCRRMEVPQSLECLIVYIDSLIDKKMLEDQVIQPLLASGSVDTFISTGIASCSVKLSDTVRSLLEGHAAIAGAGSNQVVTVSIPGIAKRSLEEPSSEPVIRGPRDGFIENMSTNISLIRARLKTSKLKVEYFTIGKLSQTKIAITYIEGVAKPSLVDEVKSRLKPIQLDGVLDSGNIEEFIEDQPFSPFPQVQSTERPDVVTGELLEGKVSLLVDTSPFALIVPVTFWAGLQASEDYYIRWPVATFVRWIRFLFINFAILAPPLYVAITTYHQEMIPTNLVLSIAGSREDVPFPAMIEALLIEIIFEALREAGIRLPKQIGQAISIVGGLVIGQAAVQAGLISAPVVIIVSITGISAFTIPRYSFANGIRLLRFPMLFLAGTLGLYGIVLGFLGIMLHVTSLRSFGVLYFSPVTPLKLAAFKDVFLRVPIWAKAALRSGGRR
ncbi:spore germination protein [Bacillus sp. 3255]|uniref:spore germination protein n=1 Tax=Bacillus sp. 3255 TaxID=2817904 RepID=UPI00285D8E42|nr:spore germination protein [Bacillus sp. 3255]MDR6880012.1 spore germination protein KA [Bacillus sp. 3255]